MTTPAGPEVIVIGAGIAGLSAAHTLSKNAHSVIVIEAASRPGGSMITDTIAGIPVDRGAQFPSSAYRVIPSLAGEAGCSPLLHETREPGAVVRNGVPVILKSGSPVSLIRSGLLGFSALGALLSYSFAFRHHLSGLSMSDYSAWAGFDHETVMSWSDREVHPEVTDFLFDPMLGGFCFQTPEESSRSLGMALSAFAFRRARTMVFEGGLGELPERLAATLDVRYGGEALAFERLDPGVRIMTSAGAMQAGAVILAVPAPLAKGLCPASIRSDHSSAHLCTSYRSSVLVSRRLCSGYRLPEPLRGVYGLLVPGSERSVVAAVGIESNKYREWPEACAPALNIMRSHHAAAGAMEMPDEFLASLAVRSTEKYLPGLEGVLSGSTVIR